MSNIAIAVEHVSKRYRLGGRPKYRTLRDSVSDAFTAPFWRRKPKDEAEETFWALDDVSFSIEHGEVLGIIGRNGAGKSTLLKVLSRITEPTKGEVRVHGRVASLLEVGTGFHPELSGRDNIFLNGAILGMKKAEIRRKFDEIVSFAEVEKFIDTPVKHYSSGMYVRLAFAVAAHLEPEILVIDEVLAVGDAQFQKKCLGKIGDVARHGRTVLFVSHNMAPIKQLCSRALVMRKGELVCDSDADSGIEFYIQSAGTVDINTILDRKEREGNGRIRFTGVDLADEFGEKDTVLRSGEDCQMILHYQVPGRAAEGRGCRGHRDQRSDGHVPPASSHQFRQRKLCLDSAGRLLRMPDSAVQSRARTLFRRYFLRHRRTALRPAARCLHADR